MIKSQMISAICVSNFQHTFIFISCNANYYPGENERYEQMRVSTNLIGWGVRRSKLQFECIHLTKYSLDLNKHFLFVSQAPAIVIYSQGREWFGVHLRDRVHSLNG